TFTIKATGLNSGQVPPVPMADVEGLRYYPDQTQDNSSISEQGIVTTITQSVALVPGVAGELILPEVRIPWWNTLENRVEYATLPEHVITVTPAATAPPSSQTSPGISEPPVEPVAGELPADSGIWKLALGASVVMNGLLLAVVAWLMLRQPSSSAASAVPDHQARKEAADKKQKEDEHYYWRELKKSARENNAQAIRENIIHWASAASGRPMTSLAQAEVWLSDVRLSAALAELDATLYSADKNSAFNGSSITLLIERAMKANKSQENQESLPELY
ncbi:MAG: hypothetical protein VYD52_00605, partial [Pseudomonadota bacterium]|nr:hypothetical protein [Pseudomonadota bacterium]